MTPTTIAIVAAVVGVVLLFAFAVIVITAGGLAVFKFRNRKPIETSDKPVATFVGVRPAPPEDLIDAGTVQTMVDRYNAQRRKARENAVLDDLAATIAADAGGDDVVLD